MKEKILNVGEKVKLQTKDREWEGNVLESYDSSIVLLKLSSGYNIGIKEGDILNVKVLEKVKETKREVKLTKNDKLPNIAMVITGGTISSRLDPKTGGVIFTDAEEILNLSPDIKDVCNIIAIEKPFMKWSENMSSQDWKVLAKTIEGLLNRDDIKGVIVSHGTDFLHYSSAALSFFLGKLNKPVALTYSQRSIDRASTDASLNLVCAAKYAVSDIAEVAIVGHKDLNDEICLAMPGVKVRKMHTSRRDTFKVINSEPFAEISKKDFKILRGFNARSDKKISIDNVYNEKVGLIKIYPGQDPAILEYYQKEGYKGIVLELAGLGQAPSNGAEYNWLPKIKKAIDSGMILVGACQTLYGRVNSKVYSAGRDLEKTGLIYMEDILPEVALVKLGWVLGHKDWAKNKEVIKEKLLENFAGEFNEKLGFE